MNTKIIETLKQNNITTLQQLIDWFDNPPSKIMEESVPTDKPKTSVEVLETKAGNMIETSNLFYEMASHLNVEGLKLLLVETFSDLSDSVGCFQIVMFDLGDRKDILHEAVIVSNSILRSLTKNDFLSDVESYTGLPVDQLTMCVHEHNVVIKEGMSYVDYFSAIGLKMIGI